MWADYWLLRGVGEEGEGVTSSYFDPSPWEDNSENVQNPEGPQENHLLVGIWPINYLQNPGQMFIPPINYAESPAQ